MDINIVEAKSHHYQEITSLLLCLDKIHFTKFPQIFNGKVDSRIDEKYFNNIIYNNEKLLLVAEKDNSVVGLILATIKNTPDDKVLNKRKYVWIDSLIVKESYQNKGIGKKLFKKVKLWCKKKEIDSIELNVWEFEESSRGFYELLGFKVLTSRMQVNI